MIGLRTDSRDKMNAGMVFDVPPNGVGITLFNDQASVIALGDVVLVGYDPDGTNGYTQGVQALAPATAAYPVFTAVALEAVAVDAIGYFQISGVVNAFIEGTTDVAAGDFLEVLNGENEWKKDGAARTLVSGAVALAAQAADSNVLTSVLLIGEGHNIAAA